VNETNETDAMDDMASQNAEIDALTIASAVGDTWNTYLGAAVEPRAGSTPTAETAGTAESEVEARIHIRADVGWEVTLRGSWNSAEEATRRMLGSSDHVGGDCEGSARTPEEYVLDAWGELVNTLAGNLKASLDFGTHKLSMPEVFRDQPSPAYTHGISEFLFAWDGYLAMVRVARITLA